MVLPSLATSEAPYDHMMARQEARESSWWARPIPIGKPLALSLAPPFVQVIPGVGAVRHADLGPQILAVEAREVDEEVGDRVELAVGGLAVVLGQRREAAVLLAELSARSWTSSSAAAHFSVPEPTSCTMSWPDWVAISAAILAGICRCGTWSMVTCTLFLVDHCSANASNHLS